MGASPKSINETGELLLILWIFRFLSDSDDQYVCFIARVLSLVLIHGPLFHSEHQGQVDEGHSSDSHDGEGADER